MDGCGGRWRKKQFIEEYPRSKGVENRARNRPGRPAWVKDRLGDQRGGSEREPIKIFLEGD
jgi:hypothetical protein